MYDSALFWNISDAYLTIHQNQKLSLTLEHFQFEVTSPAIVGLNVLRSPHLPDEGSSGLLLNFFGGTMLKFIDVWR